MTRYSEIEVLWVSIDFGDAIAPPDINKNTVTLPSGNIGEKSMYFVSTVDLSSLVLLTT
jgi:hypothetical protein